MPVFPIDVIVEILLRLPVKPLLRFRCVSKPFRALIDSHDFIKSHLKQSIETKNHLSFILGQHSLHLASLDNLHSVDHPLISRVYGTEVLGSCDGLICLYNCQEDMAIWNPSTRRHHKLPVLEIDSLGYVAVCNNLIHGFGYDPVTDDYKVVSFFQLLKGGIDSFGSFVKVYSMKSNSWRRIQDFPYYLPYKRGRGVLVGTALHWVVRRKPESDTANLIAAFDLADEDYRLVPQPEFSDRGFHMNVVGLGGCLCILCNYFHVQVDLWVMKDYGVQESWSKLFSLAQPEFDFVVPLAYSKSGCEILLVQDDSTFVWFDIKHKRIKKINIRGIPDDFEFVVCVESLIPLNGGGETYGQNQENERKKKKNTPKNNGKKRDDFLSKVFKLVL